MKMRILLIGQGLFLEGLKRILSEQPSFEVVGAVNTWKQAHEIFDQENINIVIVDYEKANLKSDDLAPLLEINSSSMKVIYLTLSTNKMIVHNQQKLTDVSVSDLIHALNIQDDESLGK